MQGLCAFGRICAAERKMCQRCPFSSRSVDIEDFGRIRLSAPEKVIAMNSTTTEPLHVGKGTVKLATTLGLETDGAPSSRQPKLKLFPQKRHMHASIAAPMSVLAEPRHHHHHHMGLQLEAETAEDDEGVQEDTVVSFASQQGRMMFTEALAEGYHESYFKLSEQFHAENSSYGTAVVSLAMILNALHVDPAHSESVVESPVWKGIWRWFSAEMLTRGNRCRLHSADETITEFSCMASRALANTVDCSVSSLSIRAVDISAFRVHVQYSVSSPNSFLVAAFDRNQLFNKQNISVTCSPIASYHAASDSVLVLDVDRRTTPYWLPLRKLFAATRGGYCVFNKQTKPDGTADAERLVRTLLQGFHTNPGLRKTADAISCEIDADAELCLALRTSSSYNHIATLAGSVSEDLLPLAAMLYAAPRDLFLRVLPANQEAAFRRRRQADSSASPILNEWQQSCASSTHWLACHVDSVMEG
ncbi:Glutathione gamma-glutamylcysteinyltransferase 1 [Diplonema papillatum]|nr:Glutathione gamma-glutamylcysteinyltransferase 1 [Diplonema papillatum]KAJ9452327.1 Glutathione gamma-glutamylcysteinyltransferase 1 [Diplonema papillatum]